MALRFHEILAASIVFGATIAAAEPTTVETASGPITLDAPPEHIVVLDVAAMDTLAGLGVIPTGVVSPVFVDYLAEIKNQSAVVGTLFEPDFEAIAALQPDLIVVGGRSLAMAEALAGIAPVADMSIGTDTIADGLSRLETYGALTGTETRAEELKAEIENRLGAARDLVADRGDALIVMTNGPKLSVFGRDSRFGWLHRELGWPVAVDDVAGSNHGEAVTFEYIAAADPDTLIVVDRGGAIGDTDARMQSTLDNELVHGTKAWKSGQIIHLPAAEAYIAAGGVQATIRILDHLIDSLSNSG